MKIGTIIDDIRAALDSHIDTKAYIKMEDILYGNDVCIRDIATSKLYWVNYNGEWWEDGECGYNPAATYYLTGDYEYYDPVRVYGVGYLTPKDEVDAYVCFDSCRDPYFHDFDWQPESEDDIDIIPLYGRDFYARGGSCEIKIKNIKSFAKHNCARKRVGARHSIPFDANAADNAIVVLIVKCHDRVDADPEQAWADIETIFGDKFDIKKLDLKGRSYGYSAN